MRRSTMRSFCHLHSSTKKSNGFTLVELLVVIGIIAILAAVLVAAGGTAIRAAQRAKASNTATQIQTAGMNYYTEYSVYPVPVTTPTGDAYMSDSDKTDWQPWIESLCGNLSPRNGTQNMTGLTPTNTRQIAFLQLKQTDVDANDCPVNPLTYDTVNHPYFNMVLDTDYSGVAGDTGNASATTIPNFTTSTQGTITYLTKGTSGGIIVWANCNTTATTTKWNPGFFVHTY